MPTPQEKYKVLYTRHYRVPAYWTPQKQRGHPVFRQNNFRYIRNVGFKDDFLQYLDWTPLPNGGATIAIVENSVGDRAYGTARCSFSDNFSYKRGRQIATNRAIKKLEVQE